jgi:hypothetical protein
MLNRYLYFMLKIMVNYLLLFVTGTKEKLIKILFSDTLY